MTGISPGVTLILASVGLLFIIFAVWAVYTQLLPSLRHPRSKPVVTLPQSSKFADPKHHRVELRRSLYSNSTPTASLFREPRNDISDYDLRNSRYSTHALDFSRAPSPESQRVRRSSQSRSRSRSRHQAQSLAELRTSLYSEPGLLLHADARSSFVNLVIDQPDVVANGSSMPRSQHYDRSRSRPRSSRHRQRQNRRSAPWMNDPWDTLPPSIFGDTQGSNNASSIDLASSPSTPALPQASWPYKHANLSAPNFSRNSRHSLPDYTTVTPSRSDARRSPTMIGANTPSGSSRISMPMTPVDQILPEWPLPTPQIDRIGSAVSLPWVAVEKVYEGKIRAGRSSVKLDDVHPAGGSLEVTATTPLVAAVEAREIDVV